MLDVTLFGPHILVLSIPIISLKKQADHLTCSSSVSSISLVFSAAMSASNFWMMKLSFNTACMFTVWPLVNIWSPNRFIGLNLNDTHTPKHLSEDVWLMCYMWCSRRGTHLDGGTTTSSKKKTSAKRFSEPVVSNPGNRCLRKKPESKSRPVQNELQYTCSTWYEQTGEVTHLLSPRVW